MLRQHDRQYVLRHQEGALHVDVDDAVPILLVERVRQCSARDAGGVQQDVDSPEALGYRRDGGGNVCLVAHVETAAEACCGRRALDCGPGGRIDRLLEVEGCYGGALAGEAGGARGSDPRGGARDESDLVVELGHALSPQSRDPRYSSSDYS
ncbi:MAG: hypothetical protein JRS35_17090 [Deltaproteobacteria bacterium]|nr:hypothetical protein [Deltaproteobacteria bacterium]